MESARQGDAEAQAGVGAMLLNHLNPPGTGFFYADSEQWLLASARQGNTKGMSFLGKFYYNDAQRLANNDRAQSARQLTKAREWFEKAAERGDPFAMGNLAILLDAGLGGPRDPQRAARLREQVGHGPTKVPETFYRDGPATAMTALWQQARYADAVQVAQAPAASGNANAQALLARAYFEGQGAPRNDALALSWAQKAAKANHRDGYYFLGLLTLNGRGVRRDITQAANYLDRAIALGSMEARSARGGIETILLHGGGGPGDGGMICNQGTPSAANPAVCRYQGRDVDPSSGRPVR
jgi:TPR repeat protein